MKIRCKIPLKNQIVCKMAGSIISSKSSRKRRLRGSAALMSEINITPFVDVMLVLLIIFMVTAPLMSTGIKVELPKSDISQLENDSNNEPIQISVDKRGYMFIESTRYTAAEIGLKLKEITKENFKTEIFVKGDKDASYEKVISAISAINKSGFTRIGLVTQPSPERNK